MRAKAPGKSYRKGLSLVQLTAMFHDDATARAWFEKQFWPNGPVCPYCHSSNVQSNIKHKTMTHRCRECPKRRMFSLKTGTVMASTNLPYKVWAIAVYLLTTNLKGVSSLKLHRDLEISQKSAWHLAHRIRKSIESNGVLFAGPVGADETYMVGKRHNMPLGKRKELYGRGPVGKVAVAGIKDRVTKQVQAKVVPNTDQGTLQGFLRDSVQPGATVYTDDAPAYESISDFEHESVKHSVGEYVNGMAHTNGIESFWSMLKRAHKGTFHYISAKHLQRYVNEFAGRQGIREHDTIQQMQLLAAGMVGRRLLYSELVA